MSVAEQVLPCDSLSEMLDIFARNRTHGTGGIYSVCSTHELVLEAAMRQAIADNSILLIEATANQVNQFGGYTGMIPSNFPAFVYQIADTSGLARERIILGGDHLGPTCWTSHPADKAMEFACELVAAYVSAGFQKIHLDASMPCHGDPDLLGDEVVAERAAMMCEAAEAAAKALQQIPPVYVIGTEVPEPGGAMEGVDDLAVTSVAASKTTIEVHKQVFHAAGLKDAWKRVIALVVQPGVEFSHIDVHAYDPDQARALSKAVLDHPGLVYEAHSTDYQPPEVYRELVRDHFAILKVGPQLTFALREAMFALAAIESELFTIEQKSNLIDVVERVMCDEPQHWTRHYPHDEPQGRFYRRYSYSDRVRYYWPHPEIAGAVEQLFANLSAVEIPASLLGQFMPNARRAASPRELVIQHVMTVTGIYSEACVRHD